MSEEWPPLGVNSPPAPSRAARERVFLLASRPHLPSAYLPGCIIGTRRKTTMQITWAIRFFYPGASGFRSGNEDRSKIVSPNL